MKNTHPTPYPALNRALKELVNSQQEILGDNFVGFYLQGSFATGDCDRHSDVDFIVVIDKELTRPQVSKLQAMHLRIYGLRSNWAQHLEGSYFPRAVLRSIAHCGQKLWYLDNGSKRLVRADHCNTVIVRWLVRERGVALAGPPPKKLVDRITPNMLREAIYKDLHHWGKYIIAHPGKFNNRFYQTFIVLSYCRMLHDLVNGTNGSKRSGAEWAKKTLDSAWRGLIGRAQRGRLKPENDCRHPPDPEDFALTLRFVRYVMAESVKYKPPERGRSV
jgi:hypothetical protein